MGAWIGIIVVVGYICCIALQAKSKNDKKNKGAGSRAKGTDSMRQDQIRARMAEARDRMATERSIKNEQEREKRDMAERNAQARRASEAAMKQVAEEEKKIAEEMQRKEGERQRAKEKPKRDREADVRNAERQQIYQDRIDNENRLTAGAKAQEAADPGYAAKEAEHASEASGSMDQIYDLIVCGYDPKKMGQRDFIAEGQKMLSDMAW